MSHEFDEAEMMPCGICGDFFPGDEMYTLSDGRTCCPNCLNALENAEDDYAEEDY